MKLKPIKFPKDELGHKNSVEWWYFNGHLKDKAAGRWAFMHCLFKVNPKKIKIPYLGRFLPKGDVYFSHSIITDIKKQKSHIAVNHLCVVSEDSFRAPLLYVNYASPFALPGGVNSEIEEIRPFQYHLKTENIDLYLKSKKPALMEKSTVITRLNRNINYYYSLTNLETEGALVVNNRRVEVKGKSWHDHQWAEASFSKTGWTWFSLQLENNTEIVCFRGGGGKNSAKLAGLMTAGGKARQTTNVVFEDRKNYWTSPKSKTKYPLSWRIKIPEFKADFSVKPLAKKQEILFGFANYWEGPLAVSGKLRGKKISGRGFLELVGYPVKAGRLKIIEEEIRQMLQNR